MYTKSSSLKIILYVFVLVHYRERRGAWWLVRLISNREVWVRPVTMLLCYVHGLDISLYVFRSSYECKLFKKLTKWSGAAFGGLAHYGGVAVFLVTSFFRNWDIL